MDKYNPLDDPKADVFYWVDKPHLTSWEQERASRHVLLKTLDQVSRELELLKASKESK